MRTEAGFLEIDWPEDETSHCFEKQTRGCTQPPFFWYQCKKCEGWKLVKVSEGLHGEMHRHIWETEPDSMTIVCPAGAE